MEVGQQRRRQLLLGTPGIGKVRLARGRSGPSLVTRLLPARCSCGIMFVKKKKKERDTP